MSNNIRTFPLVALVLLLCGFPAFAADDISLSVETTTMSQYLTNNGVRAHNKVVQQTDMFLTLPNGFYLDVWWSTGLDNNFSGDFGDEVDLTAGWTGSLGDLGIDVGMSYFDLVNIGSTSGGIGDIVQPYIKMWRSFDINLNNKLQPFVKLEYQVPTRSGVDGGSIIHLGVQHDWALRPNLSFSQEVFAVHDSGVTGLDNGFIGNYKAGFRWNINKSVYVSAPKLHLTKPLTSVDDGRDTEAVIGVSIGFNF